MLTLIQVRKKKKVKNKILDLEKVEIEIYGVYGGLV